MKNSSRGRFLGILMRVEIRLKCSPFSNLFTKKTLPIEAFFLYYFKYFDSKELIYFIRSLFSFSLFFPALAAEVLVLAGQGHDAAFEVAHPGADAGQG